ncbi:dipeptidase 1-like isoform X3 [Planococcus citri]
MIIIIICLIISACLSDSDSDSPSSSSLGPEGRLDVVRAILQEVPLVDGHNDLPWNIKKFVHNQLVKVNLSTDLRLTEPWSKSKWSHTDIRRMKLGMIGAQFWSAYVPCETQYKNAVPLTLEQIDVIKRFVSMYKDDLEFVTSAAGIKAAHKRGHIASLIGIEGGHSLGDSLGVLRMFYELGVRYVALTHKCDTLWASCCVVGDNATFVNVTGKVRGLTLFGQGIVREMNRLGMLVDLSHTSVHTMEDALNVTKAPVIFSHASAYALCNSNRNVPDHILKKVAQNGGVVMVTFYPYFISCNTISTMDQVIAHINHIRNIAGEDHIGLGSGYDGINHTTRGLEDVSHYPDLLTTLLRDHDWNETQIKKLVGLNVLRVLQQVEKVRDELQNEFQPDEDSILAHYHYKSLPSSCAVHDL